MVTMSQKSSLPQAAKSVSQALIPDSAEHLFEVKIPMLFLQGTRDTLASLDELEPLCKRLGRRATLKSFADADHSFHVPARTGRQDAEVLGEVLDALAAWLDGVIAQP
jgi:alpha-beta hydrolase superfamily lysophospholipase